MKMKQARGERVVITGMGTINALANSTEEMIPALQEGRCGIGPISLFDTASFRTQTGGEARHFHPRDLIARPYSLKRMSRADTLAFAATLEALKSAGLSPLPEALHRSLGVVIGGGAGGLLEAEGFFRDYLRTNGRHALFSRLSAVYCASSADHIATHLQLMGPKASFMTACSSSATAIGYARDLIRQGMTPIMIAGGTEPLCRITYAAFNALQAVDPQFCRPFAGNRRGLSLGEGAGVMILESLSHAQGRGAPICGEVLGYGVSCDAHHMTAPDTAASGAIRSMEAALEDAGIGPERIDYINAHGTATPANDVMETRAIKGVLGKGAYGVPISSTKSMTGHTLGASGAIEGVIAVLSISRGFIPPTIHCSEPDPECDLDYVTEGCRLLRPRIVLSNSFAFGGNNTTVIFGAFTPEGVVHE